MIEGLKTFVTAVFAGIMIGLIICPLGGLPLFAFGFLTGFVLIVFGD